MHQHSRRLNRTPSDGSTERMGLSDRKAFRHEMVYQSIRETLSSIEVATHMYKLKAMPLDDRHHRFAVMMDVAKSFFGGKEVGAKLFPAFEMMMRANAHKRFRVMIDGIYWRICETEDQFERSTRAGDSAGTQKTAHAANSDSGPQVLDLRAQPQAQTDPGGKAPHTQEAAIPQNAQVKPISLLLQ